jgi:site-specific DNA-methyltransferase (adenine-specific)
VPKITLIHGDSIERLNATGGFRDDEGNLMEAPSRRADACVTDPPYGFDFSGGAGKDWDTFKDTDLGGKFASTADDSRQFEDFTRKWSYGLLKNSLKPGSHLLAFTALRTIGPVHFGLLEAGYDIPRVMMWLYATGQVKNPTDLRPGGEPIFVGRVPTDKPLGALFKKEGRGQLHAQEWKKEDGKHPTDVLMDQSLVDGYEEVRAIVEKYPGTFFVSKPSAKERDYGCDGLDIEATFSSNLASGQFRSDCKDCGKSRKLSFKTSKCHECGGKNITLTEIEKQEDDRKNVHPTVKPVDLMRRMIRLVSRPGHTIIDPFMGSGTTGVAAVLEGRNFIGIEREADYLKICCARIGQALIDSGDAEQGQALRARAGL